MKKKILIPVIIMSIVTTFASCGKQTAQEAIATELENTTEENTKAIDTTAEGTVEAAETTTKETEAETEELEGAEEEEAETTETETAVDTQDTKSANSESALEATSSRPKSNGSASNSGSSDNESTTGSTGSSTGMVSDTTIASSETTTQITPAVPSETATQTTSTPSETVPEVSIPDGSVSVEGVGNTPAEPVQTPDPTPAPTPVQTPAPVHEHTWKEHTATTQVWVSNIVVVDDYESQTTSYNLYHCNCGFETTDGATIDQHGMDHLLANEESYYSIKEITEDQQVWVGSHEEDQGHYEPNTYVDYYYCDCGATK